jgi:hypothetical protein
MLVAVCVGILLMIYWLRERRKSPPRLEAGELNRLRRLSEKLHRDSTHPFVEP